MVIRLRPNPLGCAIFALILVSSSAGQAEHTDSVQLWHDTPAPFAQAQSLPAKNPWVIREREITFDPQLLTIMKDAAARPHPPIHIELFQNRTYELEVTSTVSRLSNLSTVRGTLKNTVRSTWSLLISGDVVNGTIQIEDYQFKVEHVQNGRHRLLEVDPAKLPPD